MLQADRIDQKKPESEPHWISNYNPEFLERLRLRRQEQASDAAVAKLARQKIEHVKKNLDRLEALDRIAEATAARRKSDLASAATMAASFPGKNIREFWRIVHRAMKLFKCEKSQLVSKCKERRFSKPRQFIMYWTCRRTSLTSTKIARLLSRDHTTVLHGAQVYVEHRRKNGRTLRVARDYKQ